ncbi:ribbon-helix-helix protein, CopG family [Corynebacterium tapiri]|uniref:Ribbon-helix-helix protein, CopG family n=1 Tax=Corynebacterium tapiri TaxID=1448266 RepID=A0A5C4U1E0_9CORY|nr:ribbon-helix-helix domain-containing protein [Corynebacterium tapiri]TNL94602.1 ribbon-helix-helix protein, CopG family [Corynebacterium tapiri]
MATKKQKPHQSGRVVSVRLEEELIGRLDSLAERTGRSKSFYIKLALRSSLSQLEEYHWEQVAARFESDTIDRQFREIMAQITEDDEAAKKARKKKD